MASTYKEPDKIKQYFASLEANLEKATGKPLPQWIKIAKSCPFEKPRERQTWFKHEHGLGAARSGLVLWHAFGQPSLGDEDPNNLVEKIFSGKFEAQRALYEKVAAFVSKLGKGSISPRKSYIALYRLKQFGAIKPGKKGLVVGLALAKYPRSARLVDVKNLGGGDRNKKAYILNSAKEFDDEVKSAIQSAYQEN